MSQYELPCQLTARTCSPSLAKLAERIDGATMISLLEQRSTREVARTRTEALPRAPADLEVAPARSAFLVIIADCIVNVGRSSTLGRPKKRFKCSEDERNQKGLSWSCKLAHAL